MKLNYLAVSATLMVGALPDHKASWSLIINLLNWLTIHTSTSKSFDHPIRWRHIVAWLINLSHLRRVILTDAPPFWSFNWWLIHRLHLAGLVSGLVMGCWHLSWLMLGVMLRRFVVAESIGYILEHWFIDIHWFEFIAIFLASGRSHGLFFLNYFISEYFGLNLQSHYRFFISL